MCNLIFLSTDSTEDLSSAGSGMYRMERVGPAEPAKAWIAWRIPTAGMLPVGTAAAAAIFYIS
jgi:hypothetical protein